jgi:hypothetical protein
MIDLRVWLAAFPYALRTDARNTIPAITAMPIPAKSTATSRGMASVDVAV